MKINLSVLKNAGIGDTTYYVGTNLNHVKHLKGCKLLCKTPFKELINVSQVIVSDPQLEFYKLSHLVDFPYTFNKNSYIKGKNCSIDPTAVIGDGVKIGNNVSIGPNSVVYSKTEIGDGTRIDSNCTIGTEGMMWVWDGDKKVFLKQLGGVKIGKNCIIGSNTVIVRGSANEYTILKDNTNLAPGCCIGHGTQIGENVHFANNVTLGGSVTIASNCFIGCAVTINPRTQLQCSNIILGAGCVVTKNLNEEGVYAGVPVKKIKNIEKNLKGIPTWTVN